MRDPAVLSLAGGMPKFLVQFVHIKEEFRLPELLAVCTLFGVRLEYTPDAYSPTVRPRPACVS